MGDFYDRSKVNDSVDNILPKKSETNNVQHSSLNYVGPKSTETENTSDSENADLSEMESFELRKLIIKDESLNGIGSDTSKTNNTSYDAHCDTALMLTKTGNLLEKGYAIVSPKNLAELNNTFHTKDFVNGSRDEELKICNIKNNSHLDDDYNLCKTSNDRVEKYERLIQELIELKLINISMQEINKLLEPRIELLEIMMNLSQNIIRLKRMKCEIFKNNLFNAVEVLENINEAVARVLKNPQSLQGFELQSILKSAKSPNVKLESDLIDDMQQISHKTHSTFLQYRDVYKRCKHFLLEFLQKTKSILNIIPNDSHIKGSSIFSTLKNLTLKIDDSLATIKEHFGEFEKLIQMYDIKSRTNIGRTDLLLIMFEKAKIANSEFDLARTELLKLYFSKA